MPTTYTHYRFGKDVLLNLPDPYKKTALEKRELFDIGLHGPDILFYYYPVCYNHVNQMGVKLHKKPAEEFFEHAAMVIRNKSNKTAGEAYIYGFICHFALDSVCHKYIEKIIEVSGIGHSEIEMELDRRLMEEDGLDPLTYVPIHHILPLKKSAFVIAPFFEGINDNEVLKALKGMRWALKQLMPLGRFKDKIVKTALKAAGLEKKYGLFMSHKANERCDPYCRLLEEKYNECISFAVRLICGYKEYLEGRKELSTEFNDTFSCGDNWRDIQL